MSYSLDKIGNYSTYIDLSDEALGHCFIAAVQPPAIDLACSSYIRDHHCAPDYEALKAITGVGKRFRQIAMSHSQLWAYLSNSYTNGWNALLIERSREHKLVVDISSLHAHQTHERSRLDSLLHTVAAEMHRVFCLRIQDASGSEFFTRHRLLGTQAPSLQIFVCGGSKENLLSSFSGPLFGGHIPQLAIMDLACIALVPCQSSLAIRNLTTLSAFEYSNQQLAQIFGIIGPPP